MAVVDFLSKKKLRRAKAIERGLKMVPVLIHLPPPSSDTQGANRDIREVMREKTAQAEVLYNLLAGTATEGFKSKFYGQRHVAFELVASGGLVHFYAAVPVALVSVVKKAVLTAYPGARLEEVEDHNIFNQEGRLAATMGGEMILRAESAYPIATYEKLERDPMEALLTTVSALGPKDGVAVQLMVRPAAPDWTKQSVLLADAKRKGRAHNLSFSAQDLVKAAVKAPEQRRDEERARMGGAQDISNLELSIIEQVEEKTKHPGFEILIRVVVSTESVAHSQQMLRDIAAAFALFDAPGSNGFRFLPALDVQGLVTAFIFRFFPPELAANVLNSVELATLFHLPDSQFTPSTSVERQHSKQVDGPVQLPTVGLLFGHNDFRGVRKEIRLSAEDRRRHTYILGQTGTGKSTMLENLAVQDMVNGNGFAFIDPHGDSAEKLLAMVPKERAEDVIYFNPADTEYPLGLNLFEFNDPTQKDFLVQETINMLYKLYDPGHTGIIGPRYEHWYRNAALTLMSDPNGATFIEIPKVFTDTEYLKKKFRYLRDPTVIDFWTKEMGQTSDYHKSEMLGWFVSKFGAFQNNEMMRNIIGQTKSSFNLRDVMDNKKILIVNLSKGRVGELNSQLLGMIFVIKFQAAAMSRAEVPEEQRADFCLYVDEFQNFSTDSFASILSEARKYRLNLVVANQFIGQLKAEVRDAVFGNIGTIVAHRMGPEDAEFMQKQFAPVFDVSDLVNLPNFNAAMRLMIGGLPSQPFSIADSAPLGKPNLELGLAVKQLSAAKFGRAKAAVEAEILDRLSGQEARPAPAAAGLPGEGAVGGGAAGAVAGPLPGMAAMAGAMGDPMATAAGPVVPATAGGGAGAVAPGPPAESLPAASPVVPPPVSPAAAGPAVVPAVTGGTPTAATPTAAPAIAAAAPAVLQKMAVAPPAIGAPPVGAAPVGVATGAGVPAPIPVNAPVMNAAGQPMSAPAAIIPEDNIDVAADAVMQQSDFRPMGAPLHAAAGQSNPLASQPVPLAGGPPPIGAPPVDLPPAPGGAAALPAAQPQPIGGGTNDPGTLSVADITGGRQLAPAAVNPAEVELVPPGSAPPPLPTPGAAMQSGGAPVPSAPSSLPPLAAPQPELGSGEPLEGDPYANIEVLGDLTPPGQPDGQAEDGLEVPTAPTGQALPNDPYANIDVLGAVPEVEGGPEQAEAVLEEEPVTVESPQGAGPSGAEAATEPAVGMEAEADAEMPGLEPEPAAEPVAEPAAEPPAPAQPLPAPPRPEPAPAPAPQPPAPQAAPPVPEPTANEPMIHFVDPDAQKVLARPEPTASNVDELQHQLVAGLPEGVTFVEQSKAVAKPPASAAAAPAARAAAPQSAGASAPAGPAAPPPPVVLGGPGVPALATELDKMAVAPPPIGAPPVASPPVPAAPAEPPQAAASQPAAPIVPASNLSLAEALERLPESSAPLAAPASAAQPKPAEPKPAEPKPAESAALQVGAQTGAQIGAPAQPPAALLAPVTAPPPNQEFAGLESVAEMLEEAKGKPAERPAAEAAAPVEAKAAQAPAKPVQPETQPAAPPTPPTPPTPSTSPPPAPAPAPASSAQTSAAEQIEKAESEIDKVVSSSLIHSDTVSGHHRLPEPAARATTDEDEAGIDMEMNGGRPAATPPPTAEQDHAAEHHGLKVIQPLEPIVPPKEQFARELEAMNQAPQQPAASQTQPRDKGRQEAAQAPAAQAAGQAPAAAAPAAAKGESAKLPAQPAPAEIVKHPGAMLGAPPGPALEGVATSEDEDLPQAESLAADDVARTRAEHEAEQKLHQAASGSQRPLDHGGPAEAKAKSGGDEPKSSAAAKAVEAQPPAADKRTQPAVMPGESGVKRKRRRYGRDKAEKQPVVTKDDNAPEHVASAAEAEHNKPTEAEKEASSLTGKVILPSGEKPKPEPVQPKLEKPKKLAPGEVFVDEHGNVLVGE